MNRVLLFFVFLLLFSQLFADDIDNQAWLTAIVSKKISDSKISIGYEDKYGNDFSDVVIRRVYASYYQKLSSHWAFDVSFKRLDFIKSDRTVRWNVPYVDLHTYWQLGDFKFDTRNRLEYFAGSQDDNFFRYRGQLRAKLAKSILFQFYPYIADEIFIDSNENKFKLNRLYLGLNKKLCPPVNLNLFYCLQSNDLQPGWSHYHVLGCTVSATF